MNKKFYNTNFPQVKPKEHDDQIRQNMYTCFQNCNPSILSFAILSGFQVLMILSTLLAPICCVDK